MPAPLHAFYRLYKWIWLGLDWFFPPYCGGCGTRGTHWCGNCQNTIEVIGCYCCQVCGKPQTTLTLCKSCSSDLPRFTQLRSWGIFKGALRQAIHRLKYRRDISLGEILSRPLIDSFKESDWKVDLIMPVPLGVARLAERGYNQATLLARPLALAVNLPFSYKALSRIRDTASQVDLNLRERKENVKGAFQAKHAAVAGKSILVIDDVATSGSTINECAGALLDAGANLVYGLTLARTPLVF